MVVQVEPRQTMLRWFQPGNFAGIVDAVQAEGPAIWAALPFDEQSRVIRHLRPYLRPVPLARSARSRARCLNFQIKS